MLTEISYVLSPGMPKWPTNPSEQLDKNLSIEQGDLCNAFSCYHHLHNGTHVDAPRHFSANGRWLAELPIEDFYYTAPLLLNLPKAKGQLVTLEDLKPHEAELERSDILCLYMHYADVREHDPDAYIDDFPTLSLEAAQYLRSGFPGLKAIAVDAVGVDSSATGAERGFPVHKALLDGGGARTLLIFEDVNLKALANVRARIQAICAFPIRWEGAEAAPVNMVAISD